MEGTTNTYQFGIRYGGIYGHAFIVNVKAPTLRIAEAAALEHRSSGRLPERLVRLDGAATAHFSITAGAER